VTDNVRQMGSTGSLTYTEMVDLSMNQTLARSLNTSLVAILPVLSVLFVGAILLGATTLLNYGVALFVGLVSGAYSSIFIASPILAMLKEREQKYINLRERLAHRREREHRMTPAEMARERGATAEREAITAATASAAASDGILRPTGDGTTAASLNRAPKGRTQRGKKRR